VIFWTDLGLASLIIWAWRRQVKATSVAALVAVSLEEGMS
jgi:hypothetical protein